MGVGEDSLEGDILFTGVGALSAKLIMFFFSF